MLDFCAFLLCFGGNLLHPVIVACIRFVLTPWLPRRDATRPTFPSSLPLLAHFLQGRRSSRLTLLCPFQVTELGALSNKLPGLGGKSATASRH